MNELQAKVNGKWKTIIRHEDKKYLALLGRKAYSRHSKQRILTLR